VTVRLRAHHLLCMLTYVGEGYGAAFTRNFDAVLGRIAAGEEIAIVAGPDEVCAPLLAEDEPHCLLPSVTARDESAAREVSDFFGLDIRSESGLRLDASRLAAMRAAFVRGELRSACLQCAWFELCSTVATGGFAGVRL
jgi:hypothetical protein